MIHSGTLQTGHYVAYIKIQKDWYKCDDHKISQATEYDVLTSEAYVILIEFIHQLIFILQLSSILYQISIFLQFRIGFFY